MVEQIINKGLEVEKGITKLIAPHKDGKLIFVYPYKGPDTYVNIGEAIAQESLARPIAEETASLVYASWQNPDNKYSAEIIRLLGARWLWMFTGNLYVPKIPNEQASNGVIIQDDPEIANGRISMDKSKLIKKLEAGDGSVRFVPFGYKIEQQSSRELAKNSYVIGLVGEQGAEKLVEVADKYKKKPYVWSFKNVDKEIIRASALGAGWYDARLNVDGDCLGDGRGCAFGVKKSGEATRAGK